MTARSDAQARFERRPATVLELDLDYCSNTYGVSPCTAGRVESGTAQAGGASSITLRAAASGVDGAYDGMTVRITGGTGSGQERKISAYVGATKVATVSAAWSVAPDATSVYDVIDRPNGCYNVFAGKSPCQDKPNYVLGVKTIKFCSRGMKAPAGELVRPYIEKDQVAATEIDPTKGLAVRSKTTFTLTDEPARDDLDKYVDDRAAPAQGTYMQRLLARNPNAVGRFARARRGYVVEPWDWGTFQTELYTIETLKGPDGEGRFTLSVSDTLRLLDRMKLPAATSGKLQAALPAVDTTDFAQSGTATTIVLATSASNVDSAYVGHEVFITGGVGAGQRRVISAYVGVSRTATVPAWDTVPDSTSHYEVVPLSFNVGSGFGSQYGAVVLTYGTDEYLRIGDEVIRFGSIVGDVVSWPDGTYRAQFGTARADHKANDGVQQCLAWIDQPATNVVYDVLSLGGIVDANLDLAGLAVEEATWFGPKAHLTVCVPDPEKASDLLTDLLKDLNLMVWWHPVEQLVKFKVNAPEVGSPAMTITDDDLVRSQTSVEVLDDERLTRAAIDYDLVSATADRKLRTNYRVPDIFVEIDAESDNGYGDVRDDLRQSRWLTAANSVFAKGGVERRLLAVVDAPVKVTMALDLRKEPTLGALVDVQIRKLVDAAGVKQKGRHRVVKVTDRGRYFETVTRSTRFGKRYAFICPNGYPDYPLADDDQRTRAFIASNSGLMSDGSSAYLII